MTGAVAVAVRFGWREARRPSPTLLTAAARPLDDSRLPSADDGGRHELVLAQRTPAPTTSIGELLDVAKAESGRLEPHPAEVDLRALLHQLRGTLQGTAQPGVHLRIPDHVQRGPLVTDEVMLTRILRNVLSNA
ncbi:hypothetical protein QQY24_26645 [Streptomyces sp. TG1A-8]|nr:hypothetical protein [Streptomyces sp. TG1A-8]MDO0928818.1 hypothetical protein [Streptomyces sp. TG1A-8]